VIPFSRFRDCSVKSERGMPHKGQDLSKRFVPYRAAYVSGDTAHVLPDSGEPPTRDPRGFRPAGG
jgi:hypothetical protein